MGKMGKRILKKIEKLDKKAGKPIHQLEGLVDYLDEIIEKFSGKTK